MSETVMSDQSTAIQETDIRTVKTVLELVNMETVNHFSLAHPRDTLENICPDYLTENFETVVKFKCGREFEVYKLSSDLYYVENQNSYEFKTFEGMMEESKEKITEIVGMCEDWPAVSKSDGQIETEFKDIEDHAEFLMNR